MNNKRVIHLEGAYNFRDMGGLQTHKGKCMRNDLLYRSAELSKVSPSDLEKIQSIALKTIIDLRTPNERKHKIDRLPPNSNSRVVSIPIYPTPDDPGRLRKLYWFLSGKFKNVDFEAFTKEFYYRIAFNHTSQIKEIMGLISTANNLPALLHCSGGKDRTGFLSAIIQLLIGVPHEKVMEDYLLTNELIVPQIERIYHQYNWVPLFKLPLERMRPVFEARTEYLDETLNHIFKKHTTISCYLQEACGISQKTLTDVQQLLLN